MCEEFQIMPGLPTYGEWPEQFSATGTGTFREGLVVKFHPAGSAAWVGNFQPGLTAFSEIIRHPDDALLIVVAGGQAYVVNTGSRESIEEFGGMIVAAIPSVADGLVVFGDPTCFWAYGSSGRLWESERLSWDGFRDVRLEGKHLTGEAWSLDDTWHPFSVDIRTGESQGGAYLEWHRPDA